MPLKARLSAVIGFLSLLTIAVGLLGLIGMNESNKGLKSVYEDHTVALEQVPRIDRLLVQNRLLLSEALHDSIDARIKTSVDMIEKKVAEINQVWSAYMLTYLTPEEKILADKFALDRGQMTKEGLFPALAALREGKIDVAGQMKAKLQPLIPAVTQDINALRQLQVDEAEKKYEQSSSRYIFLRNVIAATIALSALIAALSGFFLIRTVYRPLGGEPDYALRIVHSIAAGDLTVSVAIQPGDQQSLLFAMQTMRQHLAKTVGHIHQSTVTMATASAQIAAGNLDLSSRTEEQAGGLLQAVSVPKLESGRVEIPLLQRQAGHCGGAAQANSRNTCTVRRQRGLGSFLKPNSRPKWVRLPMPTS